MSYDEQRVSSESKNGNDSNAEDYDFWPPEEESNVECPSQREAAFWGFGY